MTRTPRPARAGYRVPFRRQGRAASRASASAYNDRHGDTAASRPTPDRWVAFPACGASASRWRPLLRSSPTAARWATSWGSTRTSNRRTSGRRFCSPQKRSENGSCLSRLVNEVPGRQRPVASMGRVRAVATAGPPIADSGCAPTHLRYLIHQARTPESWELSAASDVGLPWTSVQSRRPTAAVSRTRCDPRLAARQDRVHALPQPRRVGREHQRGVTFVEHPLPLLHLRGELTGRPPRVAGVDAHGPVGPRRREHGAQILEVGTHVHPRQHAFGALAGARLTQQHDRRLGLHRAAPVDRQLGSTRVGQVRKGLAQRHLARLIDHDAYRPFTVMLDEQDDRLREARIAHPRRGVEQSPSAHLRRIAAERHL